MDIKEKVAILKEIKDQIVSSLTNLRSKSKPKHGSPPIENRDAELKEAIYNGLMIDELLGDEKWKIFIKAYTEYRELLIGELGHKIQAGSPGIENQAALIAGMTMAFVPMSLIRNRAEQAKKEVESLMSEAEKEEVLNTMRIQG